VIVEVGDIDSGSGDTEPYRYIKSDTASISDFGLRQRRINNSSVVDDTVAEELASAFLERYSTFARNMSLTLPFNKELIETSLPLPRAVIYTASMPLKYKYSTFKYGDGTKYSGVNHHRIDSISYSLKDASIETYIELNWGKPDITNRFEKLQFDLEQRRQAAGV
jgi:hypothetical protein